MRLVYVRVIFFSYVAAMEKALKNFEYSSDWPDLINALTKLSKVVTTLLLL